MRGIWTRIAVLLIASIFLGCGEPEKESDGTNPTLFEVRQQCEEIAAFFPVSLALARRWVPPAFNLEVDAQGDAGGALIFMNCPEYYSLTTPNSPPLKLGENTAPGSVVHLWFMLQGPAQVLPVPGAELTAPTQYAYAVADLVTSPTVARVYRRAGKNAVPVSSTTLVDEGTGQTGEIRFTNGSKITLNAYTPTQFPTPLRVGGNVWNWYANGPVEMGKNLGGQLDPAVGNTKNVNTTRVMFLGTVPGPPNTTHVSINAEPGTAFADYFGSSHVVASRATLFRPNNIVNNSSRGKLAWTTYPPYALNCPPLLPK